MPTSTSLPVAAPVGAVRGGKSETKTMEAPRPPRAAPAADAFEKARFTPVLFRDPDGTDILRKGEGVSNPTVLKTMSTLLSCGLGLCCKTTFLAPEQYIIVRNINGETGVLGAGDKGDVFAWKLVLNTVEIRNISEDEPVERGTLKIVPVAAGTYRACYNVITRQHILLRPGIHVINDPEMGIAKDRRGAFMPSFPITAQHINTGTAHIVRVNDGEVLTYRLNNKASMVEGPLVLEIDDATFEFDKIHKCSDSYIHIDNLHRFSVPEGRVATVIADGKGMFLTESHRDIIEAKEMLLVREEGTYIHDIDSERIRAGNLVRIKVRATQVGIAVDGDGSLRILPTGVHHFEDPDFKWYGSISSEQRNMKVKKLRETAGDSGEATFDIAFAYRIDINDPEAVKKVYNNLGKNATEVATKVQSMVVQKALSAFGHCDLGNRQDGLEKRGMGSVEKVSAGAGSAAEAPSPVPAVPDHMMPPAEASVKDMIVGELMGEGEGSLKQVLSVKFGIILDYVGIEQIKMPEELAVQMQKQAIATAAGRAHVLEAEADAAAAKARAEGEREVLEIKARTDKSLAEIRAEAKMIGAKAEADAIRQVGAAKKDALAGLSPDAVQVMIAREASEAIRAGNTTLVGSGVDGVATMMALGAMGKMRVDGPVR